jgi:hypothetical protein
MQGLILTIPNVTAGPLERHAGEFRPFVRDLVRPSASTQV